MNLTQSATLDKTVSAAAKIVDPYIILDAITKELGLDKELEKRVFVNPFV